MFGCEGAEISEGFFGELLFRQSELFNAIFNVADSSVSLTGHPQCLRNVRIVGLLSDLESRSLADDGASDPTSGTRLTLSAGGVIQDANSCWKVIVAD